MERGGGRKRAAGAMPSIPEEREGPADAMRSLQDRALDVVVQQLLSWKETTVQLRSLGRWSSLPSDLLGRILARLADNLKEITEAPAQVALKVRNHDFWLEALDVAVSAEPWGKRPTALSGHLRAQERLNTTVLSRLTCIVALALHGGAGCTEVFEVLPKLEKLEVLSVRTGGQAPTPRPSKDTLGPCLAKCKRLRALDISDTEIGDDTVKFLRMLESLELLHICARKCSETGILALVRPPAAGAGLGKLRWLRVAGEVAGAKEGVDWTLRHTAGKLAPEVFRIDLGSKVWVRPAPPPRANAHAEQDTPVTLESDSRAAPGPVGGDAPVTLTASASRDSDSTATAEPAGVGPGVLMDAAGWEWSTEWAGVEEAALAGGARIMVTNHHSRVSFGGSTAGSAFSRLHSLLCTAQVKAITSSQSAGPGASSRHEDSRVFHGQGARPIKNNTIKGRFGAVSLVSGPPSKRPRTAPPPLLPYGSR